MLTLQRVSVGYGDAPAVLRDVPVTVRPGRVLALTGVAGETTG
ncbi:hypothetical protein [Micromonospora parva]